MFRILFKTSGGRLRFPYDVQCFNLSLPLVFVYDFKNIYFTRIIIDNNNRSATRGL